MAVVAHLVRVVLREDGHCCQHLAAQQTKPKLETAQGTHWPPDQYLIASNGQE